MELLVGLGGDLMIGRLVNAYLDHVSPDYVWGNLQSLLKSTDVNLVNLENTFTKSIEIVPKAFNFKADPEKVAVLTAGRIDVVNIANNHILDFSESGLLETIEILDNAHISHVGAGRDKKSAQKPYILNKNGIKIGFLGCTDNEPTWKATVNSPGINFVEVGDFKELAPSVVKLRKEVDIIILSMHWGPNMRQRPTHQFVNFAHGLIDLGVDVIHGHSAHIFQGVEIYKNKLILYDTGDLVDDYAVDPILKNDRSFFFLLKLNKKGLISLKMIPTKISDFQVNISFEEDSLKVMENLCQDFKTPVSREYTGGLLCKISA